MPKLATISCRLRNGVELEACVHDGFGFDEILHFLEVAFSHFWWKHGPEWLYTSDVFRADASPGHAEDDGVWLAVSHPRVSEGKPVRTIDWVHSLAHAHAVGMLVYKEGGGWEDFLNRMEMARWGDD